MDHNVLDKIEELIREGGHTATINEVTSTLEKSGLDPTSRLLLSNKTLYAALLHRALEVDRVNPDDSKGIRHAVQRNLREAKRDFYRHLVLGTFERESLVVSESQSEIVVERLLRNEPPLARGKAGQAVLRELQRVRSEGVFPEWVHYYLTTHGEVDPDDTSADFRRRMVDYLRSLNLRSDVGMDYVKAGKMDEYLATAYVHALQAGDGGADPVTQKYQRGGVPSWDFVIDTLQEYDDQPIDATNIRASGALYYIYELGDNLGIFHIADHLVLDWAKGLLDIPVGNTASLLYRYLRLREERHSVEERAMLYKRVFSIGDANLLSGMVGNDQFPILWNQLMSETAEYIRRTEESSGSRRISTQPIYRIIRELQYNLTGNMTGMAHMATTEMYNHLQDALGILGAPEVVDQLAGGYRRSAWTVAENILRMRFGGRDGSGIPNISAIRTAAVKGYQILDRVATFTEADAQNEGLVTDFVEDVEAYILTMAQSGGLATTRLGPDPTADDAHDDEEWDDWDA